jgi:hypothetical protein
VAGLSNYYKGKPSRKLPSDTSLPAITSVRVSRQATLKHALENQLFQTTVITLSVADVSKTRSTFTRPQGQMDYQEVYSEHALTIWQVSSLTFSTCP